MTTSYLSPLGFPTDRQTCGAKADQIRWLSDNGYLVPRTFVLPFAAEAAYRQDARTFKNQLAGELGSALDEGKRYAVRSSANVEDQSAYSFAGQFTTALDVKGASGVLETVISLYDRLADEPPETYLNRIGAKGTSLRLAVIIQEMVDAEVSGVSFSKNPLTGLDEVIVEAVTGSGAGLLQGGQTPDRWVARWGGWVQEPEQTTIDPGLIERVVAQTKKIAEAFGAPVDLEWVYGSERLYWVQVRPITTAGDVQIYSNRIAKEVLPGLIKPLVWSINTPLVNRAWVDLFTELIGQNAIDPDTLARPFYFRAYFNMGVIGQIFDLLGLPAESLELLLGLEGGSDRPTFKPSRKTYHHLPRMVGFVVHKLRFQRVISKEVPRMEAAFNHLASINLETQSPEQLLEWIETLNRAAQAAAYLNIVTPLLMSGYAAMLKRQLAGLGIDFTLFDLSEGHDGLANYDLNVHLASLQEEFNRLGQTAQAHAASSPPEEWLEQPGLEDFYTSFLEFTNRFGHLSDSGNDFSRQPWREDPALLVKMIRDFHRPDRAQQKIRFEDLSLPIYKYIPVRFLFRKAQDFRYHREVVSSLYTYGYGLFRRYFLALGGYFKRQGVLGEPAEIFYLTYDEVTEAVNKGKPPADFAALVQQRIEAMAAAREITLPEVIYGDEPPPPKQKNETRQRLAGIPSSRGYYEGPVTVIQRAQDFDRLNPGDVLVIPYSDVSWTPLFGKAGAVIAESGGLLSHSSIVAREFSIPCVVSVHGACQLPDRVEVAVDGYSGEITVLRTRD